MNLYCWKKLEKGKVVMKIINENNEFREGYLHSQLLNNYSNKIRSRTISRLRFNYGETIKKTGPVCIDIGPGRGEMLDLLVESGKSSVAAVDINEDIVLMIENKFPTVAVELTPNTADFFSKKVNKYNLITMLHVLEHIEVDEAIDLLKKINNSLTDDGVLLVEVPNSGNIFTGNLIWASDVTHKVKYTSKSLHQILLMAGFDSVEIKCIRSPINSAIRIIQTPLVYFLEFIQTLILKLVIPSEKYLHSVAIFAIIKKSKNVINK